MTQGAPPPRWSAAGRWAWTVWLARRPPAAKARWSFGGRAGARRSGTVAGGHGRWSAPRAVGAWGPVQGGRRARRPWWGAGGGEDPAQRWGHARRRAWGVSARPPGRGRRARADAAGAARRAGPRGTAARARDGDAPRAQPHALRRGLEALQAVAPGRDPPLPPPPSVPQGPRAWPGPSRGARQTARAPPRGRTPGGPAGPQRGASAAQRPRGARGGRAGGGGWRAPHALGCAPGTRACGARSGAPRPPRPCLPP
jgi:hypothetical protein